MHRPSFRLGTVAAAAFLVVAAGAAHAQAAASAAAPASAASQADAVQSVVVTASADASKGGLKAPYAGGQVARGGRVGILGSEDVMDTPFTITNYTSKLIEDQQAASLADVLQNDPAVRVTRGYGNFQQAYMVRGLVIYSDDVSYNGLYGLLPRQYLAAELVERVEVLRGASAFINGAAPGGSGLGGAVNVGPKRAGSAPMAQATIGYDDGQLSEAADVSRRFGPGKELGVRVNLVHRDGKSDAIDGQKGRLDAALVGADFHTGNLRVSADLGLQDNRLKAVTPSITIASGVAVPTAPDASRQIAQPWTYSNEADTFGTLRAEYDLGKDVTVWAAGGFRIGREANRLQSLTVTAADGTDSLYASDTARKDTIKTGEVGVRGTVRTGSVKHALVASFSTYQSDTKTAYAFSDYFTGQVSGGTIYDTTFVSVPAETYWVSGDLGAPKTTSRVITSSVALADTLSFLDDRVLLSIGARRQKIEDTSYSSYGDTAPNKKAGITPVVGAVFKLNQQVSLYANYIEGLVAGDVAPTVSNGVTLTNGGKAFAPYATKQGEIGVKVDTGHYGGTVSLFTSHKPTYAVVDDTFGQSSVQRNRGAELSVYGEALPGVRVLGGASFLHTDVGGRDAIGSPEAQYNLGLDFDVPGVLGLALNVRGVHTDKQYADSANTQVVPSWNRLDIGGRYAFDLDAHSVTLRAGINNVTNRNYWASSGGYPGAGYLTLGTPRTVAVSATFSY